MDNERLSLSFLTDGGAGNLFVQINFIYCVYHYLEEDKPEITVFGHKSEELNRLLMQDADFIEHYYPPAQLNRGYESDAFILIEFFPDVMSEKEGLRDKSDKAYRLISVWKGFMSDMQRRYGIMHPVVNYNAYAYAINNGKNVLNIADVGDVIGVPRDYRWKLDLIDEDGYLKSLGLEEDGYITVQRGATPGSFQKESTKLWPVRYYEELIRLLKQLYPKKTIIQVGEKSNSEQLAGIDMDLLGETTWNELGLLLKGAWLHIDCECGMVHFRRAMTDKPTVVLFGPTPIEFYGYDGNINIHSNVYRKWCARLTNSWSERCMKGDIEPACMATILPGAVFEKIAAWTRLSQVKEGNEAEVRSENDRLYADKSIRLDAVHKKSFLDQYKIIHYEREMIEVGKLKVFRVDEQSYSFVPLKETAAYRVLSGQCDWKEYEEYIKLLQTRDYNAIHSSERFRQLISDLDEKGYDHTIPILIDTNDRILDGQHRASYIAAKNGLDYQAEVVRIFRLGDESWDYFPFERVKRGSKVVIYGCGEIGESYIRQIDYTGYCEIGGLIDRNADAWNARKRKRDRIECQSPYDFVKDNQELDYIVIASRGGKNMCDMRSFLLANGIKEEKIISYVCD